MITNVLIENAKVSSSIAEAAAKRMDGLITADQFRKERDRIHRENPITVVYDGKIYKNSEDLREHLNKQGVGGLGLRGTDHKGVQSKPRQTYDPVTGKFGGQ